MPMNDLGRPRDDDAEARGVCMDGKRTDDGSGVEVTVKVDGVRIAVGEGGNTKRVWDGVFTRDTVEKVCRGSCMLRVLCKTLFRNKTDGDACFQASTDG